MTAPSIAHRALAISRETSGTKHRKSFIGAYVDLLKAAGQWQPEYEHNALRAHKVTVDHPLLNGSRCVPKKPKSAQDLY